MRSTIGMLVMLSSIVGAPGCAAEVDEPAKAEEPLTVYGTSDGSQPKVLTEEQKGDRVTHHGGRVLAAMKVQLVYVGALDEGGVALKDDLVAWTLASGDAYWGVLSQYGVGKGSVAGSVRIAKRTLVPSETDDGLITVADLEARVRELLHPASGKSIVPPAEAYAFFLPAGLNVSLGNRGSKVWKTCVDVGAYHRYSGSEPYAVFPSCELGLSARAITHELAEMATDPVVGTGWFSDADIDQGIGEIADLCNRAVVTPIHGFAVTELWSNLHKGCVPLK